MSYFSRSRSLKDRPIVILLQPHISMSFFEKGYLDPPDDKRLVSALMKMVKVRRFNLRGLLSLTARNE